jgi:C_GCAxxG_C_C family probable redox protein
MKYSIQTAEDRAIHYFSIGYHCSETVTAAVLETVYGEIEPVCLRIANPFMGGIAGTKANACGALSGGLIVLGYRYGRTNANQDDRICVDLSQKFYQRFEQSFGLNNVNCHVLYENRKNSSCNLYVTTATRLILEIIEQQEHA